MALTNLGPVEVYVDGVLLGRATSVEITTGLHGVTEDTVRIEGMQQQQPATVRVMSINEIRATQGLPPILGGEATVEVDEDGEIIPVGDSSDDEQERTNLDWVHRTVWPVIRDRLVAMAHPEARAMAEAAAEVPGLDELALYALADWLEEKQYGELAGRIRKLDVGPDDLFILQHPGRLSSQARKNLREAWDRIFAARGQDAPVVIVLEEGMKLSQLRLSSKPKQEGVG